MVINLAEAMPIASPSDILLVRQKVRTVAQQSSLSLIDVAKFVTARSELARNTPIYGGGKALIESLQEERRVSGSVRKRDRDDTTFLLARVR